MADDTVAAYRKSADECRQQADCSVRSGDKAQWLRLAEQWQALAESVEKTTLGSATIKLVREGK